MVGMRRYNSQANRAIVGPSYYTKTKKQPFRITLRSYFFPAPVFCADVFVAQVKNREKRSRLNSQIKV